MQLSTDYIPDIIQLQTVGEALRLLKAFAVDKPELKERIQEITYGIKLKFHYNKWEQGLYTAKLKRNEVIIDGNHYILEEVWDEIDNRIALTQKYLIEELHNPSSYKPRD